MEVEVQSSELGKVLRSLGGGKYPSVTKQVLSLTEGS